MDSSFEFGCRFGYLMSYVRIVVERARRQAGVVGVLKTRLKEEQHLKPKLREILEICVKQQDPIIQETQSIAFERLSECERELKDLLPESIGSEVLPYLAEIHESLLESDFEGASKTLARLDDAVKVDLDNRPPSYWIIPTLDRQRRTNN